MSKTQREAVYSAVMSILKAAKIDFTDGGDISTVISSDQRKEVITNVIAQFNSGEATCTKEYNEQELKTYTNGLVSNWFRKDTRLNGGSKYEIKNKGSRAGQGNPKIKETKKLLKQVAGTPNEAKVQAVLDKLMAEHKASKAKSETIDASQLPEELRSLVG